jgi:hypothetical protein
MEQRLVFSQLIRKPSVILGKLEEVNKKLISQGNI